MAEHPLKILVVDDDVDYRDHLASALASQGFAVEQATTGNQAVRMVRRDKTIDVVVLERLVPGMEEDRALRELREFRPEVQVVILTRSESMGSARKAGKLGVFKYLTKPMPLGELSEELRAAGREKTYALALQNMPASRPQTWKGRLVGSQNLRPLVIILGAVFLLAAALLPVPASLETLVGAGRTGDPLADPHTGYPAYQKLQPGASIADHYSQRYRPPGLGTGSDAESGTARRALLMIGLIMTAVLFWATGAIPIGSTALVVGAVMYMGGIMRADGIAQAFAKDSVVFIFGILVLSRVVTGTGLDRRVAMLLLMPIRRPSHLLFFFVPILALTCSFISEAILIALLMPLFLVVHRKLVDDNPGQDLRPVLVMFALMLCFGANVGGPGSPAAGGRNAVMIGILADYGMAPSFLEWMKYGLPFVPVAGLGVGAYFYAAFRLRLHVRSMDVARIARESSRRLGPMTRDEHWTAAVCLLVIGMWIFGGERLGMGGPVLIGLIILNLIGVLKWGEVTRIHWDVIFMYAGASALGKGLAATGGALFLARGFVGLLPDALGETGLLFAVSLLTGVVTNFMSDGATVAAVGPIAVPMAQAAGMHPWMLGFAAAFASSFAHLLIIGTPANALVYILCKDPRTGKQMVTQADFLKHGAAVFVISFAVLWAWTFVGYWQWLGFD